jgi:hypothetical protein
MRQRTNYLAVLFPNGTTKLFRSIKCSAFRIRNSNQADPHLNLGTEGSLRAYGDSPKHKTRVFLLLNEVLRNVLGEEASLSLRTRGQRTRPKHLLPSPLFFLRNYLTDPTFPASDAYVHAIVRSVIFAEAIKYYHFLTDKGRAGVLERATGLPISGKSVEIIRYFCSFELVVDALRKIQLHKNIRDISYPSNPADFIVMHMLASRGHMLLSFPLSKSDAPKRRPELRETRDEFLKRGIGGEHQEQRLGGLDAPGGGACPDAGVGEAPASQIRLPARLASPPMPMQAARRVKRAPVEEQHFAAPGLLTRVMARLRSP